MNSITCHLDPRIIRQSRSDLLLTLCQLALFTAALLQFAYSILPCFKIGTSESASFQSEKKSSYAARALALSPAVA